MTDEELWEKRSNKDLCERQYKRILDLNKTLDFAREALRKADGRALELSRRSGLDAREREAIELASRLFEGTPAGTALLGLLERMKRAV